MKLQLIIIWGVFFIFSSCEKNDPPTEIVFAEQLLKDFETQNEAFESGFQRTRMEYYIIVNPPKNRDSLIKIVKAHGESLKFFNDSIEKKYDMFRRAYFKESKKTPVDFVEDCGGGFITDCIDDHTEDFICSYSMKSGNIKYGQEPKTWTNTCKTDD